MLLAHLLTNAITRHIEGLRLTLNRHASLISAQYSYRPSPTWRALPIYWLETVRRFPNPHIRALRDQQSPQFAIGHAHKRRPPRQHTHFPLLRKLTRMRCILGEKQIFARLARPKRSTGLVPKTER